MRHQSVQRKIQQRQKRQARQAETFTVAAFHQALADLGQLQANLLRAARAERDTLFSPAAGGQAMRTEEAEIPYAELWAEVEFTDQAADYIRAGEWRFISPEFDMDYVDEGSGDRIGAALLAIGLTNRPFLKGMAPVELAEDDNIAEIQVCVSGEFHHLWYGRFTIEPRHLQEMIDNLPVVFAAVQEGSDRSTDLVVDYNHGSLMPDPEGGKAAGWLTERGLWIVEGQAKKKAARVPSAGRGTLALSIPPAGGTAMYDSALLLSMADARIRELLELAADVPITQEHRDQALEKLLQMATEPPKPEISEPIVEPAPAVEPAVAPEPVALEPAPELVAEPVAATAPPGTVTLTAEQHAALAAQAEAGAEAAEKLRLKEAEEKVAGLVSSGQLAPAQVEWATAYALKDAAGFAAYAKAAPVILKPGRLGSSESGEADDAQRVQTYIAQQQSRGLTLAAAQAAALKALGPEAFETYRRPNRTA